MIFRAVAGCPGVRVGRKALPRTTQMSTWNLLERVRGLLVAIVIGYLLVLAILRIFESRLIFFPDYPNRLDGDWHPRSLPV